MKKTYIQPSIEAVNIQQSVMLGGSENISSTLIMNKNDIASKRGDFEFVEIEDED